MIKAIAIALNLGLLLFLAYVTVREGFDPTLEGRVFVAASILSAIVNLLAIREGKDKTWLGLYIERRKLEEENKIDDLRRKS